MSTTVNHVSILTPRVAPLNSRGAQLASMLFTATFGTLARLLAPPKARMLSRAEEAESVRELAWRVRKSDPGFSADLYAAAARHEGLAD